jgi:hypothetical protein
VTILLAALFADAPDPVSALLNAGGVGVVAFVLYLLHRDALKAFREELAAERAANREEMALERAASRDAWEKLAAMSDRQHGENRERLEKLHDAVTDLGRCR